MLESALKSFFELAPDTLDWEHAQGVVYSEIEEHAKRRVANKRFSQLDWEEVANEAYMRLERKRISWCIAGSPPPHPGSEDARAFIGKVVYRAAQDVSRQKFGWPLLPDPDDAGANDDSFDYTDNRLVVETWLQVQDPYLRRLRVFLWLNLFWPYHCDEANNSPLDLQWLLRPMGIKRADPLRHELSILRGLLFPGRKLKPWALIADDQIHLEILRSFFDGVSYRDNWLVSVGCSDDRRWQPVRRIHKGHLRVRIQTPSGETFNAKLKDSTKFGLGISIEEVDIPEHDQGKELAITIYPQNPGELPTIHGHTVPSPSSDTLGISLDPRTMTDEHKNFLEP